MHLFTASASGIAPAAAATAKTVLEITNGSNRRLLLRRWWCEFNASSASNGVLVELMRASAAMTGTSITPAALDTGDSGASGVTARHTATAEGTATTPALEAHYVMNQAGREWEFPLGGEVIVPVSGIIRIRVTVPTGATPPPALAAGFVWHE
jgi:hypothetical protein